MSMYDDFYNPFGRYPWIDPFASYPFMDEPPYFGPLRVEFPTWSYLQPYSEISTIFPRLDVFVDHQTINVSKLTRRLARKFSRYVYMTPDRIFQCLAELFEILRECRGNVATFRKYVKRRLLNSDGLGHAYRGLVDLRSRFIFLGFFASKTESSNLASAMAYFFLTNKESIVLSEPIENLGAWGLAYMDIQPLLTEVEIANCLRALGMRLDELRECFRWRTHFDKKAQPLIQNIEDVMMNYPPLRLPPYDGYDMGSRGRRRDRWYPETPRARTLPPIPMIQPAQLQMMQFLPAPVPRHRLSASPPMAMASLRPRSRDLYHPDDVVNTLVEGQMMLADGQMRLADGQMRLEDRLEESQVRTDLGFQMVSGQIEELHDKFDELLS